MKLRTIVIIFLIAGIFGCKDQVIEFPDYELKAVYFPLQLPLRSLSIGEDRVDNSLDREYKFDIGVSIGGMYENYQDWTVDYVVDPALTDSVYNSSDIKIRPLPQAYYTLSPANTVIIPKGSFNGLIRVQLTDEFFADTLALLGAYVIPLRLTATSADSILKGKSALPTGVVPDERVKADWESMKDPKNWVMFGIKYVNAYHGWYLHRGRDIRVETATGIHVDTVIFRDKYRERDPLIKLASVGKTKAITDGIADKKGADYSMTLEFGNDTGASGDIVIKPVEGKPYAVTGTGKYFDKANSSEQWSLLTWQSMYLNYSYVDGAYTHHVVDTLVFRDRDLKFEELSIKINE